MLAAEAELAIVEAQKGDIITPANDEMTPHPAYKSLDGIEVDGYRVTVTDAEGNRTSLMLEDQTTQARNRIYVDVLVAVERQFAVPSILTDVRNELSSIIKFVGNKPGLGPHSAGTIDFSSL
jgi:hypothetical protein